MKLSTQPPKQDEATCANCGKIFARSRPNQIHCSPNCRKAHSQKARRTENPVNSRSSPTKRRRDQEFFERSLRLAEMLYGLPVSERLGFMQELIEEARSGNTALREILTNQYLLKANRDNRRLFHRKCPAAYFTIAQAADRYCRKFWAANIREVVYGLAPEPPTGEIISSENVVTIINKGDEDERAAVAIGLMRDAVAMNCTNHERLTSFDSAVDLEDDHPAWQSLGLGQGVCVGLSNEHR